MSGVVVHRRACCVGSSGNIVRGGRASDRPGGVRLVTVRMRAGLSARGMRGVVAVRVTADAGDSSARDGGG